ncbi:hypothetical protein EX30DRAFT_367631 [Ascodesmis nigricans]|uniref:Rhodopsin domain-containing protein n=1 Tax=Ascodesmis nigricans TaxID=341454 RepID=A0A4S2N5L6_9PEZI|nr:hypothetical protein EX30DRAFT_367631 [Ascodesmis nigricans]
MLCLLAYAKLVAGFVCSLVRGKTKLMTNDTTLPAESSVSAMKLLVVELMLIPASIWLTKASVLSTIYGVKNRAPAKRRIILDIVGVVILSTWLIVICTYTLSCKPFSAQWSMDPRYFCSPILKIREQTIFTVLDIGCNVVIVVGCFAVFDITVLPRRDRMSVLYILFLVFLECGACLIRIAILAVSGVESMSSGTVNTVIFLSRVEIALGIMAASWPTLRSIIDTSLFCVDVTMGSDGHSDFAKTVQGGGKIPACQRILARLTGPQNRASHWGINGRRAKNDGDIAMMDVELHFSKGRLSDEGNLMGLESGGGAVGKEMGLGGQMDGIERVGARSQRSGSGATGKGTIESAITTWSETMPETKQGSG